jgi:hypothetical protein
MTKPQTWSRSVCFSFRSFKPVRSPQAATSTLIHLLSEGDTLTATVLYVAGTSSRSPTVTAPASRRAPDRSLATPRPANPAPAPARRQDPATRPPPPDRSANPVPPATARQARGAARDQDEEELLDDRRSFVAYHTCPPALKTAAKQKARQTDVSICRAYVLSATPRPQCGWGQSPDPTEPRTDPPTNRSPPRANIQLPRSYHACQPPSDTIEVSRPVPNVCQLGHAAITAEMKKQPPRRVTADMIGVPAQPQNHPGDDTGRREDLAVACDYVQV